MAPVFDFHHEVHERGEDAVRQLAGLAPLRAWRGPAITPRVAEAGQVTHAMLREYDYWTRAIPALHVAYKGMCAYLARYIERDGVPTVDHFVALRNASDPMLAYTWSNYRLACGLMNGRKTSSPGVLDPFEIEDGWFALDLNDFKTVVGPRAPRDKVEMIQRTIKVLGLDSPEVVEARRRVARRYWEPPANHSPIPLWAIAADHPFLAQELRRQGRTREEE